MQMVETMASDVMTFFQGFCDECRVLLAAKPGNKKGGLDRLSPHQLPDGFGRHRAGAIIESQQKPAIGSAPKLPLNQQTQCHCDAVHADEHQHNRGRYPCEADDVRKQRNALSWKRCVGSQRDGRLPGLDFVTP